MKNDKKKLMDDRMIISNIRIVQAISIGIMTLGVSMGAGDLAQVAELAISSLSITTSLFGFVGTVMSEIMIGRIKKDEK